MHERKSLNQRGLAFLAARFDAEADHGKEDTSQESAEGIGRYQRR